MNLLVAAVKNAPNGALSEDSTCRHHFNSRPSHLTRDTFIPLSYSDYSDFQGVIWIIVALWWSRFYGGLFSFKQAGRRWQWRWQQQDLKCGNCVEDLKTVKYSQCAQPRTQLVLVKHTKTFVVVHQHHLFELWPKENDTRATWDERQDLTKRCSKDGRNERKTSI